MRSAVFLPIPGIAWKRAESLSAIARWSSSGERARHDGERHLGPDAADAEELYEERALGCVGEAVELQSVLAHVEVRLDRHLGRAVGAPQDARGRAHQVADAGDVDDEPVERPAGRCAAKPGDHRSTPWSGEPSA